jgi:hypothetical protein
MMRASGHANEQKKTLLVEVSFSLQDSYDY